MAIGDYHEKFFNCKNCGTEHISALRHMKCPQCGASKPDQNSEYFSSVLITDADGLALAKGGPNWVCSNCDSRNLSKYTDCQYCGNPLDPSDPRYKVRDAYPAPKPQESHVLSSKPRIVARLPHLSSNQPMISRVQLDKRTVIILCILALAITVIGIAAFLHFHTRSVEGEVTRVTWERIVSVYRYEVVHHTGETSKPSGAYNDSSYIVIKKVPHYEDETIHHECSREVDLGNGASQTVDCSYDTTEKVQNGYDDVPETQYDYDLNEWVYEYQISKNGEGREPTPEWPDYSLNLAGQEVLGAENAFGKEIYMIYFTDLSSKEPKEYTLETSVEADWLLYRFETRYPLEVNSFNEVRNNPYTDKLNAAATTQP